MVLSLRSRALGRMGERRRTLGTLNGEPENGSVLDLQNGELVALKLDDFAAIRLDDRAPQ